jgi:hypothetical protein
VLDEHFVRAEIMAGHPEAAVAELLEFSRLERLSELADPSAEAGAKHREVGADPELGGVDRTECDFLHAKLICDLACVSRCAIRPFNHQAPQRLTIPAARGGARLPGEGHDTADCGHVVDYLVVRLLELWPTGEED